MILADTPSDSSISPDKKRTRIIYPNNGRSDKGKRPVSFRAASRLTENGMTHESSHPKQYSKNGCKFAARDSVGKEYIVLDEENGKQTPNRMIPVGTASQTVKPKFVSLNTRTTLASFHDTLLKLNEAQKNAVRDIGFGHILDLKVKELPGRIAYWALKSFNPKTCELEISPTFRVKVTVDDVYRVFGVPQGDKTIIRFGRHMSSDLFHEWVSFFAVDNRDKIKIGLVLNEMVRCKNGGIWFKRHFMIAMCFSLFESFSNGTVHPHILSTLFDVENLEKWDWAEYMIRSLVENRETWGGYDSKMYIGPSLFLVLFYVDRINITGAITSRLFPILLNWSSNDLRERQKIESTRPKFGIGKLRESLKLPSRYISKSKQTVSCGLASRVVDEFVVSKKLVEDAKNIADRMNALTILANSASLKEKQSKTFKDSVEEVFKLIGFRLVVKSESPKAVVVDLDDDLVYPDEFYVWMDATTSKAISKKKIINRKELDIPSFDLCDVDEQVVFNSEVPGSLVMLPSSSKSSSYQIKFGDSKISGNQGYYTPQKTAHGNKSKNVLNPLDTNIINLPFDVSGSLDTPLSSRKTSSHQYIII
ncbi:uncharacterized protein LOC130994385 [Salvia miltiorrhiza]|uniref:uncharacterized protein LOC130994385 n=1 Tax=Salvia miltiorrhiza TaxID=226208 RepID=UPI0025ABA4E5|nr:uncharacterized protein LOC130994385 [Salvia miltiorrhiza]